VVLRRRRIGLSGARRPPSVPSIVALRLQFGRAMLKLLGSYVIAKVLGFGIVGAIVIYLLLTLLT